MEICHPSPPPPSPSRKPDPSWTGLRLLLLFAFLLGNLVFMVYKASLTAELAARRERLPFNRLEHLLESDYRYTGTKKNDSKLIQNCHIGA